MASIMTSSAKLVFFYGVPLAKKSDTNYREGKVFSGLEMEEEQTAQFEAAITTRNPRPSDRGGLYELGDVNDASLIFGVPLLVVDLHKSCHHIEAHQAVSKISAQVKRTYRNLLAAQSKDLRRIIKKLSNGQPRQIACLSLSI